MANSTELVQRTDLLIANGQQTADLLRHLANNHIDSDYFAVTSECEAYGTEIDAELTITDFALRAAGYVDALVEALEIAEQNSEGVAGMAEHYETTISMLKSRIAELEARTVKLPSLNPKMFNDAVMFGYLKAQKEAVEFCAAAGINVTVERE